MSHDEYAQQLARQNDCKSCQHCHSLSGHYCGCVVLSARYETAYATVQPLRDKLVNTEPTFTPYDVKLLNALGVTL